MNATSSPSLVLPSRAHAGGAVVRLALRTLRAHWRAYREERRQLRALGAISEMDVHMLKDIGAPDELISRAAAQGGRCGRDIPFQLWMVLVAIIVIGTATPTLVAEAAKADPARAVHAAGQLPGVFTGEYVAGAPIYRFPAVVVTSPHKTKHAERAAQTTPPRQTRASSTRVAA